VHQELLAAAPSATAVGEEETSLSPSLYKLLSLSQAERRVGV